jgi:NADH-quinone oxidoreductase subunit L
LEQSREQALVTLPFCDTPIPLYETLYYAGLFTAFLTAVYTFRAFFLTFYGETRVPPEAGHHAHESPAPMLVPLAVLAICSLVAGWCQGPFSEFLRQTPSLAYRVLPHAEHPGNLHFQVQMLSTIIAVAGAGLATFLYLGDRRAVELLARWLKSAAGLRLYQLSYGKFFFDAIYAVVFVWPLWLLARVSYWLDQWLVDGLVNLAGRVPVAFGSMMRALQNGMLQFYALAMMLGLLVLIGTLLALPR